MYKVNVQFFKRMIKGINIFNFYQLVFFSYYRFIVREFTYNEVELAAGKNEISKLVTDKKKQFVSNTLNHLISIV